MTRTVVCSSCKSVMKITSFVDKDGDSIDISPTMLSEALCFYCGDDYSLYLKNEPEEPNVLSEE